jgi:enoyl-CoA hydratase/carnithine racemase
MARSQDRMTELACVETALDRRTRVGTLTFSRGRENRIDTTLLEQLVTALRELTDDGARAVVLRSGIRHFCAGVDLRRDPGKDGRHLYDLVPALFAVPVPLIAAVSGAAVGAGLGLALAADFRVTCERARFWANFSRLGFSQGFGLSLTLPRAVGAQRAAELLYTGRRVEGAEAVRIGLADQLVNDDEVNVAAAALATEIAGSAPLAVAAIRDGLRSELLARLPAALTAERRDQERLVRTADFTEGVRATRDRRPAQFRGA